MKYLDNNATSQTIPEVRAAMISALDQAFGNPSSAHSLGDFSRVVVENSRKSVANLIGAVPGNIVFSGSGSEANTLAIISAATRKDEFPRIITTQVEHSSVLKSCEKLEETDVDVVYLQVDRSGRVSMENLEAALSPETVLVSVQWVNNETGVYQPIETIGKACERHGVPFHCDAAQAAGKIPISVSDIPVDFLTLTAHKFHGPQGVGALYFRDQNTLKPLIYGGPQESGLRAGTENVSGIAGMGAAAEQCLKNMDETASYVGNLRDRFEELLFASISDIEVNGNRKNRLYNCSNLRFPGIDGQALVVRLDQEGVICSQSSACTSLRPEPSYVLRAMGLSEDEAYESVRFSFSKLNTMTEIEEAVGIITRLHRDLKSFRDRPTMSEMKVVE